MSGRINFKLNTPNDIDRVIKELEKYRDIVCSKSEIFVQRLAEVGLPIIDEKMNAAIGDSNPEHYAYIKINSFGDYAEANLIVEGRDLLFIEFGAGVHYNGSTGSSPNPSEVWDKPSDGVRFSHEGGKDRGYTIGSYGHGLGKNDSWFYTNEKGDSVRSYGTKATMPMYSAELEIISKIQKIAKEVFSDG